MNVSPGNASNGSQYEDDNVDTVHDGHDTPPAGQQPNQIGCSIKTLPSRLLEKASKIAVDINPVNAPNVSALAQLAGATDSIMQPQFLTLLVSKYWGASPRRLSVSFMEPTAPDLRKRILGHMNAWSKTACISFVETSGTGNVRISRGGGGYWSYLGTDIMLIPKAQQTMNLQGFTMNTLDSEFYRVIRHETGHTLGFPHEHMRREIISLIDRAKAYAYFLQTQGWDRATVDAQVLTPLDPSKIKGTAADQTSIMCYQLPGSITKNGKPILGGKDINATDYAFAGQVYPKPHAAAKTGSHQEESTEDWGTEDDLTDDMIEAAIQETLV